MKDSPLERDTLQALCPFFWFQYFIGWILWTQTEQLKYYDMLIWAANHPKRGKWLVFNPVKTYRENQR